MGSPNWAQLSPAQQQILAPLQSDWPQMDHSRRSKWLEVAARYPGLPPDQQVRLRERMQQWSNMTPSQRQAVRANYLDLTHPPGKAPPHTEAAQSKLQTQWEAYQALPPEKRQRLVERAAERAASQQAESSPSPIKRRTNATVQPSQMTVPKALPDAPTVVQIRPGASTVIRKAAPAEAARPPAGVASAARLSPWRASAVDPVTLLPRTPQP
ncbi:DUF3106 domain-containing protein [Roseateles sp. BYS180W]|uniref:DUF3106 domain-containing protein n=1 Tax=Roseateles rivi TaxID=3299028 RepID=A0ABW7FVY0_9BURK